MSRIWNGPSDAPVPIHHVLSTVSGSATSSTSSPSSSWSRGGSASRPDAAGEPGTRPTTTLIVRGGGGSRLVGDRTARGERRRSGGPGEVNLHKCWTLSLLLSFRSLEFTGAKGFCGASV